MKPLLLYQKILFFCFGLLFLFPFPVFSQSNDLKPFNNKSWIVKPFERKAFIENKGQFDDRLPSDKKDFNYCIDKGCQIFFYDNQISYCFTKTVKSKGTLFNIFEKEEKREERERKLVSETQYIDVKWLNANPDATIIVEDKQSTYFSYVIASKNEKPNTIMCAGYSKLIYKNLYKGIDVEYVFHPETGIEYNLLIHPGANLNQVKMQYSGAIKIFVKEGNIRIPCLAGDIIDHAPVTFYANSNEKIASSFSVNNNIVSFNVSPFLKDREIIIDPWTVVPGFSPSQAFDNGIDDAGNIYIYGGSSGSFKVEKYASSGGAPIWSLDPGIDKSYYGDMLVDGAGNFYLSEGYVGGGAHTYKYATTSTLTWQSTADGSFREHWRLALNCITNKVIVAGGGTTSPTLNIAEIDVNTGTLLNAKSVYNQSQSDVAGLCVDELGKAYLKHSNPNILTYTDNLNNTIANVPDGYNLSEIGIGGTPSYYPNNIANGYNFMTLGGTSFLFTTDGAEVKKWDRNTQALLSSVTIPGGQQNMGSGILADKCNNLFVGASNGVYRFDFNLVQKEYKASPSEVYDIAYAPNSDIVASGNGFLTPLPFGREPCGADSIIITSDPCNPEINTVVVIPTQGVPPFSFFWDDGNTDSVRSNLTIGNHILTVKDGVCNASFYTDTVEISGDTKAISVEQINPKCNLSSDGEIKISLLKNQTIINVTWLPAITNSLLNDSTTKAVGLTGGSYTCQISSSLGCIFDTTITLIAPPLLLDSLKSRKAICPLDANGSVTAYPYGGTTPYTYTWNTSPVQTTQGITNLTVGLYKVTISDSNSCKKIDSVLIGSSPVPVINFAAETVCLGDTTEFTNSSSITSGTFNSVWLMGNNGDSATTTNTSYFYPACADYIAKLTITSDSGCVASLTKTVTVSCQPSALFTASDTVGCEPVCLSFQNSPLVPSGVNVQWAWSLGDGSPVSTSQNFEHCYDNDSVFAPNYYTVTLTVTTDGGCDATVTKTNYITVYPNPVANFTAQPQLTTITDPLITFTNLSTGATILDWNFSDFASSTLFNPQPISYSDTGTYLTTLITSTVYGCEDTAYQRVTIDPDFTFYIPNAFSPNGDSINDSFNGKGIFIKEYEMRIYDRWGNMIFFTDDINKPWDGRANHGNEMAQMDVYVYLVQVTDMKRRKHNYRGIVTLVR